jgi:two-component system cell cycle sensor histidine kinase/response regulator CckA
MAKKRLDQPLDTLARRFQALQDQAHRMPAASRKKLEPALRELVQAIAALRAAPEAEMPLPAEIPGRQEAQRRSKNESLWPLGPTACPDRCETILNHLFMAIPDLFNVIDRDYHILMSNWHGPGESVPQAARRGRPKCHQLLWGRERPCEDCQVREVFATGQFQERQKFHPATGQFIEISAYPIRDEASRVVLVAEHVRDITQSHRAAKALQESEERFRAIFETAQDSVFIKDRSLRYIMANPAMGRLFDRPVADLIGRDDRELWGEEAAGIIRQVDQRVLNGEVVKEVHTVPIQGVPTTFHVIIFPLHDDVGEVIAVCGIARDITELKQAEEALRQSETKYRTLIENIPQKVFIKDRDSRYVSCNQNFAQDCGIRPEEVVGKVDYDFFPRELADKYRGDDQRIMETGRTENIEEKYIQDGQEVWVSTIKTPVKDDNANIVGVLGTFFDITERKRAEQALQESEERFRAIFDYNPVGIAMADLTGRFLQSNHAYQEIVGYTAEELQGLTYQDLTHPEDLPENLRLVEGLQSGKRRHVSLEKRYLRKDGTIRLARMTVNLLRDARGEPQYLLGTIIDITARKQAEEALRQSEQRFRDITEYATEWVWEVDAQGKYTYSSPVVEQLLGYQPEEVLGKHFYDFFLPEEQEDLKNTGLAVFAARQPFRDFLHPNLHKNGQIVWLSTSGIPILDPQGNLRGYRGVDIDITERREAEELSRNLIARSPVGVYLIQNGRFQLVNQWFFTTTGYREDESLHLDPMDLVHPEDREATRENAVKMLKGLSAVPYEYRTITKGGETKWIMETLASIQYQGKRATLGYFMDITERKALEEQLLQAQKMEAVGRLAGGVAHDFNNLLMAIMGYSELMRAKVLKDDPLYENLENILKAGGQAAALTQQLLTFSRRQIVHPQVIDLKQVIQDLEPMLQRVLEEDIELEIISDPMPVAVKGDPGHLSQIIMNLVVNARDAMPRGGRLSLKTASVDLPKGHHTRFGLTPPGAYVELEVRDTGVGMDEATQAHIFEPFFTTKEPGKGTGLGLSTVYGIVKQSGGYLDLNSEPGKGSAFTILLPRLKGMVQQPKVKIPITESFRGEETILLVEDEDVLRALLAKFLRLYGYAVLEARHGGEALLICERHPGPIHLLVTDVVMPQMSGRELADRLTPLRPKMQVLYMSGYADDAMVHHGVADLSVPFLQKPFKPIDLARQVHDVLHPAGQP